MFIFDSFIRLVLLPVALATLICDTEKSILKLPFVKGQHQIFNTSQVSLPFKSSHLLVVRLSKTSSAISSIIQLLQ